MIRLQNQSQQPLTNMPHAGVKNKIPTFNIMPDLSKSIDCFNGERGPRTANNWMQQIQNTALLHHWPDKITFQTANSHLDEAAKHRSSVFEESKIELWKKMCERIQCPKEVKEQVVIDLLSRDLSNFFMSRPHSDEDKLYRDILDYERVVYCRKLRTADKRDSKPIGWQFEKKNDKYTRSTESPIPATTKPNPTRCYNSNLPGHYVSDCTKPHRPRGSCFNCGSTEHFERNRLKKPIKVENTQPNTAAGGTTLLLEKEEIKSAYLVPIKLKFNIKAN
ncbi:hypothetical protein ILUMI_12848 [Ignelater luminosus]|uniref:CCHC-type domain-containing protein n=1 Tax=Ignelater luminosus TaxID=2038154 RepID=A0A8K0GBE4_IGNLU|nr:hypothetical protein ILUMI_12848 [Ignelater luminosus]